MGLNPDFVILTGLLILMLILYILFIRYKIGKKMSKLLFSDKKQEETVRMCPKCSSTEIKFPNPLKASNSIFNLYSLVNNLSECKDCGYIGIFPEVNTEKIKEVKKIHKQMLDTNQISNELTWGISRSNAKENRTIFEVIIAIIITLLLFELTGVIGGTLFGVAATLWILKMHQNRINGKLEKKKDSLSRKK